VEGTGRGEDGVEATKRAVLVVNTYRVWLRYELFRGRLSDSEFQASEMCLVHFIKARGKPFH
jgi:hypothetical protein